MYEIYTLLRPVQSKNCSRAAICKCNAARLYCTVGGILRRLYAVGKGTNSIDRQLLTQHYVNIYLDIGTCGFANFTAHHLQT